jgi:formate dehydrogenase major subunit
MFDFRPSVEQHGDDICHATLGDRIIVSRLPWHWPVVRQLTRRDPTGRGDAARSRWSDQLAPRTATAERTVQSICPFCAVGCGQRIFVRSNKILQIEGDQDSPISRGHLCPKGAATQSMVESPTRLTKVRYRRAYGTEWEELPLERAMTMIADRVIAARRASWQDEDDQGRSLRRCMGMASLGGATMDNEENYLWKKLFTAWGAIQIENQARI